LAGHDTAGIAPLVARIGQIPRGADSLALYYRIQGMDRFFSTGSSLPTMIGGTHSRWRYIDRWHRPNRCHSRFRQQLSDRPDSFANSRCSIPANHMPRQSRLDTLWYWMRSW